MATASTTRLVPVPPASAWEALAAYGDLSTWGTGVDHSALLTPEPPGVGAVRRVQVGRVALRETVVAWVPGRTLAYAITGLPAVVTHAQNTWTLEPEGGGTRVTLSAEVITRPPFAARVVVRVVGRTNAGLVDGLAAHLEAGALVR